MRNFECEDGLSVRIAEVGCRRVNKVYVRFCGDGERASLNQQTVIHFSMYE